MTSLISLRVWLGLCLISAYESPPGQQPLQTVRVFADLKHTGILEGPLASSSQAPNDFGIAVPIPSGSAGRERWPDKLDADDPMVERLGRLRVEATEVAGDVVVSIEEFAARAGLTLVAPEVDELCDQWMQDTIEPGVFAYPTAAGRSQARCCLSGIRKRSGPSAASLDQQVATWLRRQGVVTVAPGNPRKHARSTDWYGNLEATPPHTDRKGRTFRYGRVIVGKQSEVTMHPGVLRFLESQGVQWPPIVVDTSWLAIGHIDEVVNFVPAKGTAGFKVLLPSPKAARDVLHGAFGKRARRGAGVRGNGRRDDPRCAADDNRGDIGKPCD